jgi:transcriptional regulator with XRE-family HTH domain
MLQRHISAALDIDNAMYCKIERGERRASTEHLSILADILQADREDMLTLWLADQVYEIVGNEDVKTAVLNIVVGNIVEYKKGKKYENIY